MLRGHCHCGVCRFEVPQEAIKFGFASCHCSACRLVHAAPFVQWSGVHSASHDSFQYTGPELRNYNSSDECTRKFCPICGTHVYIEYSGGGESGRWTGEVHFPTALLDSDSIVLLEKTMELAGKPRYLHVFYSDRSTCLGDLDSWAHAPRYGGASGLEPLDK